MTGVAAGQPPPGAEPAQAAAEPGGLAMEAVSISKDFRLGRGHTLHAVREVSLSLYRGKVVALVGESGSGKSTVARLLAGQETLTSGSIQLHGQPVSLATRRAFRQHKSDVQLVFQDPFASLNPVHTVRYHLQRPVRLQQHKRSSAEVGREVDTLQVGDRVVIPFNIACGHCFMCDHGLQSQCETTQNRDQGTGAALFG